MRKRKRNKAELNVVPYIDVMLVLLVIFMLATPLIQNSMIEIDLPEHDASLEMPENASLDLLPLVLSIDNNGQYFLNRENKEALSAEEIIEITAQELDLHPDLPVLVQGDANVAYEKITQGILLLQRGGAARVSLVTQPPEDEQ